MEQILNFLPPYYRYPALVATCSFLGFTALYYLSGRISRVIAPKSYAALAVRSRFHWDSRLVAFVHAVLIIPGALRALLYDETLYSDRVFNSSDSANFLFGIAVGYFLWDTIVCLVKFSAFGFPFLAHAVACLLVYGFCLYPFLQYYGCFFLLFEASTPFLNIHWFLSRYTDHGVPQSLIYINGGLLIASFFILRIVMGPYFSYWVWKELLADYFGSGLAPTMLIYYYLSANILLNGLNFYWFNTILSFVRRADPKGKQSTNGRAKAA